MTFRITLPFGGEDIGCFNPQHFVALVTREFPETELDRTDWSADEVERIDAISLTSCASNETRSVIRRQIRGKSLRNGPTYRFTVTLPSGARLEGCVSRFRAFMTTNERPSREECDRVRSFFSSVTLGALKYQES